MNVANAWARRSGESAKAHAAFAAYLNLSPRERSIDAAWRQSAGKERAERAQNAPRHWYRWSSQFEWVARAAAYDEAQAEIERTKWEQRRRTLQERDWAQADRMRAIVDEAQVMAEQFLRSKTTTIPGAPTVVDADGNVIRQGTPTRQLITTALDIVAVSRVMLDASKQQRLATGESTENINNLSGAALDAIIERELNQRLAGLADGGKAPVAGASLGDETDPDARATDGDATLPD